MIGAWLKKFLGSVEPEPNSVQIMRAYGAVLENAETAMDGSMALDDLPFDKATIKAALIEVANMDGVSAEQLNAIGVSYVSLGAFQSGGGGENLLKSIKTDVASMSPDELREFAQRMSETDSPERRRVREAVVAESEALLAEWESLTERRAMK